MWTLFLRGNHACDGRAAYGPEARSDGDRGAWVPSARACPNRQGAVVDFVLLLRRLGVAAAHRLSSRRSSWCTRYGQAAGERTPPAWVMSADWGEPGITVAVR